MTDLITRLEQAEAGSRESGQQEWGLFHSMDWREPRPFAAILIGRTAKRVTFAKPRRFGEPITRKADWLLVGGLTEAQAVKAAERATSSLAQMDQEQKSAKQRHRDRMAKIVEHLRAIKEQADG